MRRVLVVLTAVAATASLILAGPAAADPRPDRYALGDSVMLGAKSNLKTLGFDTVNATVSRQAYGAGALLRGLGAALPANVVVHLGTNGTFPMDVCRAIVRAAGPARQVFLVTVHVDRSWTASNNRMLRACAEEFGPERVTLVDWDAAATRNPGWLYTDGAHLRPAGARGYARLIGEAVDRTGR